MKSKTKLLIILLILVVFFSAATVSAADTNSTVQKMSNDNDDNIIEISDENNLSQNSYDNSTLEVAISENCESPVLNSTKETPVSTVKDVKSDDSTITPVKNKNIKKNVVKALPVKKTKTPTKVSKATKNNKLKSSFKIVNLYPKNSRYVTKWYGKYKIQVYKWMGRSIGGLEVFLLKYGKYNVKSKSFLTRAYFKMNGRWRWSSWSHATSSFQLKHHYPVSRGVLIYRVQVLFKY